MVVGTREKTNFTVRLLVKFSNVYRSCYFFHVKFALTGIRKKLYWK